MAKSYVVLPSGEITLKAPKSLEDFQNLVGGIIEEIRFPGREDVTCYVNEEGKLPIHPMEELGPEGEVVIVHRPLFKNIVATNIVKSSLFFHDDYIVGPMVITGFDPATGEHTHCPLTVEEILDGS